MTFVPWQLNFEREFPLTKIHQIYISICTIAPLTNLMTSIMADMVHVIFNMKYFLSQALRTDSRDWQEFWNGPFSIKIQLKSL